MKYDEGTVFDASGAEGQPAYDQIVGFESNYNPEGGEPRAVYIVDTFDEEGGMRNRDQRFDVDQYHEWIDEGQLEEIEEDEVPF